MAHAARIYVALACKLRAVEQCKQLFIFWSVSVYQKITTFCIKAHATIVIASELAKEKLAILKEGLDATERAI